MERTENPDGFTIADRLGSHTIRFVPPRLVEMILRGGLHESAIPLLTAEIEREFARTPTLRLFVDTTATGSYTSDYRRGWGAWLSDNRARLEEVHVLVTSRLVAMGLQLVNTMLGGMIKSHSARATYEAAKQRGATATSASER